MKYSFSKKHPFIYDLIEKTKLYLKVFTKENFRKDYIEYNKKNTRKDFEAVEAEVTPCLIDKYLEAGTLDEHYFLQDIYVAKQIIKESPQNHFDIGSRVDGFISHLLCANIDVTMIDIRPLSIEIEGLHFIKDDATKLDNIEDDSLESISCLHAAEHFGLGRYGDKIEPEACFLFMKAVIKKLKSGGWLYFSVPVGNQNKVCFNAHRIFKPSLILQEFAQLKCEKFLHISDYKMHEISEPEIDTLSEYEKAISDYDCGIFIFRKLNNL